MSATVTAISSHPVPMPMTDDHTSYLAILYADICDSVRLYEALGDAQAHQMADQSMRRMVDITQRHDGTIIRTQGDGVMATFPTAPGACEAAHEMQAAHGEGPVKIKVGFNFGGVIERDDDVYGDAVNLAARITGLARSGEILTTEMTIAKLTPEQRATSRLFDQTTVKGKAEPVRIHTLVSSADTQSTTVIGQVTGSMDLPKGPRSRMTLTYRDKPVELEPFPGPIVIGRSSDCDLVVNSSLASRRHVSIEPKRNHYVITDHSTNGTYVVLPNGSTIFLKRDATPLVGSGWISLGCKPSKNTEDLIRYTQVSD